jgi:hypothetical protein
MAKSKKKLKQSAGPARKQPGRVKPSVALEAAGGDGGVKALQSKLDALGRIADTLRARLGKSAADDDSINAEVDSLIDQQRAVEALIAAAEDGTLDPPTEEDVSALQDAITAADDVIAQNAKVDQLIKAAAALIKTLKK